MAKIWRNIAGRLGARLSAWSSSSTSRVADRASDPASYKLTFFQGVCLTVGSCYAAVTLVNYWFDFERSRAERRAWDEELERAGLKASFALDEALKREFREWKLRQLGAHILPRETKMKAEQLARARKD